MAVISVTTNVPGSDLVAGDQDVMPHAYADIVWDSRPIKIIITVPPGNTITSLFQTAGLPCLDIPDFTEQVPGSGIWEAYTNPAPFGNPATVWPLGTTTNSFDVEESGAPGVPTTFSFKVVALPNPYHEVAIRVNGVPQPGTVTAVQNATGTITLTGTAIVSIPAGAVVDLISNAPDDLNLSGLNSASLTIQKLD